MSRARQEEAVQDAADQLRYRFPNLMVSEDIKLDDNDNPYVEVYRCTASDGPKLSGKVFPNGSLAVGIDMLSTKEFERVMIALWGNNNNKAQKQYIFTVGARPKPTKHESKKLYVFTIEARPKPIKRRKKGS
jgi:hypothetical protein